MKKIFKKIIASTLISAISILSLSSGTYALGEKAILKRATLIMCMEVLSVSY